MRFFLNAFLMVIPFLFGINDALGKDIERLQYYSDGKIMVKEIMQKIDVNNIDSSDQNLIYIKRYVYRKNGILQIESFFEKGVCIREIKYDKQERKYYEYIFDHGLNKEITAVSNGLNKLYSTTYKTMWYNQGRLFMIESRVNDKRDGLTEIYNQNGIVKKRLVHKNGKKISTEKISID